MAWKQWLWIIALGVIAIGGIIFGFRKQPVPVESARVTTGPMQVTVEEEGKTRLKSRYIVSAPVAGFMRRLRWNAGDRVRSGQVITVLEPTGSTLLDPRSREQNEARVRAAQAGVQVAESRVQTAAEQLRSAQADLDYWSKERDRQQRLVKTGDLAAQTLDKTLVEVRRAEAAVAAAQSTVKTTRDEIQSARAEVEVARAALHPESSRGSAATTVPVTAPAGGRVIRVIQESEGVVAPGTPLIEIGDANAIEVSIEVLSPDAVRIAPGTRVLFTGWGGGKPIEGRVRVIEPGGFTKVSALGVEEQRVRVIADITSPESEWKRLGDGYRVEATFILWESGNVLHVPANALFRFEDGWAVFVVEEKHARRRKVEVGHRSGLEAEILSGLNAGDLVIQHPDETIEDGAPVEIT